MTTDTEKHFFETFGIEPKYAYLVTDTFYTNNSHTFYITKDDLIDYFEGKNCGRYKVIKVYKIPEITDRILLELICIVLNAYDKLEVYTEYTVEKVKEKTLKQLILAQDDVYSQVQALFKEG